MGLDVAIGSRFDGTLGVKIDVKGVRCHFGVPDLSGFWFLLHPKEPGTSTVMASRRRYLVPLTIVPN